MLWLVVILSAYFLFAIVALGDKYLLAGPPNPKSYSFYVGTLGALSLVLIPFVDFSIPEFNQIVLGLLAGAIFLFAQFWLFTGFEHFEASRVVPAIGGLLSLFTFGLVFLFSGQGFLSFWQILAFASLLIGSILITLERKKTITLKSLKISALAAFLFGLSFVLTKFVYLSQPFWSGFIWMRIGGFLAALSFLFTKEVQREIFAKKFTFQKKTGSIFLLVQALGGGAFILQNWAIALVPLSFLAFVNALEGTKYVFLFAFAILFSLKFPKTLKEKISPETIFQKVLAILLIGAGLVILALK